MMVYPKHFAAYSGVREMSPLQRLALKGWPG